MQSKCSMLYKRSIKALGILVIMWIVSLFAIIREFSSRKTSFAVLGDEQQYQMALNRFRQKYKTRDGKMLNVSDSDFGVWKYFEDADTSIPLAQKLTMIKGYDFPPGMEGKAVILSDKLTGNIKTLVKKGWQNHAFNEFVSDIIPVNRTLLDPRESWCKLKKYTEMLPQASVVICFHNEAWSTLLRTVHSVISRTPAYLLKEIILFDDFSNMAHLKLPLDDYIRTLDKVTLVRVIRREGLIRARMLALKYVTAPVVAFLDSHCECAEGWLEPLLDRIARDKTRVASPVIDKIHDNTFEYIPQDVHDLQIGGFSWNLRFTWNDLPRELLLKRKHAVTPVKTPTISGGIFAINRIFFETLGLYDDQFDIWGAENLELSFKTWMCGGSLEIVPCSHVGHVFRKRFPYIGQKGSARRNSVRLAEVWLDDYAKYFFERIGNEKGDYGNVTNRIELRKKLKCRSFDWYLKNVYPDIEVPDKYVASGQIFSTDNDEMCLDVPTALQNLEDGIQLLPCHYQDGNQFWVYTSRGEIKRDDLCLDCIMNVVTLYLCKVRSPSQVWLYDNKTQLIRNMYNQKCLRAVRQQTGWGVILDTCLNADKEKWIMENFQPEKLAEELKNNNAMNESANVLMDTF